MPPKHLIHGMINGLGWIGRLHRPMEWTGGCVAVTGREMDEIWRAVPTGTPIGIGPWIPHPACGGAGRGVAWPHRERTSGEMADRLYHVLIHRGDALADVDAALKVLEGRGVGREASGFHKYMHVTQASQTVVMVQGRQSPLAAELRARPGWTEPGDDPLDA
jgi:hypothetical protein